MSDLHRWGGGILYVVAFALTCSLAVVVVNSRQGTMRQETASSRATDSGTRGQAVDTIGLTPKPWATKGLIISIHSAVAKDADGGIALSFQAFVNLTATNHQRFADAHGYAYRYLTAPDPAFKSRDIRWHKIIFTIKMLDEGYPWVFWTDSDSLFTNCKLDPFKEWVKSGKDFLFVPDQHVIMASGQYWVRNTPWARRFFKEAWKSHDMIVTEWMEWSFRSNRERMCPGWHEDARLRKVKIGRSCCPRKDCSDNAGFWQAMFGHLCVQTHECMNMAKNGIKSWGKGNQSHDSRNAMCIERELKPEAKEHIMCLRNPVDMNSDTGVTRGCHCIRLATFLSTMAP